MPSEVSGDYRDDRNWPIGNRECRGMVKPVHFRPEVGAEGTAARAYTSVSKIIACLRMCSRSSIGSDHHYRL